MRSVSLWVMRIPDPTKSSDAQDLTIIIQLSEIVQQSSDACKNMAIDTLLSLQGNGVDTASNSVVLKEVEQELYTAVLSGSPGMLFFSHLLVIS